MTKDRFDDIIKDKMESMKMESNGNAWEDFSKRLDSELGPEYEKTIDRQLDAEVHQKMNNLKASFKSSHWLLLKDKLETQALYLKNLYSSKAFELVIFLLLFITFAQQLPLPVQFELDNKIYALDHSINKIELTTLKPIDKIKHPYQTQSIAGSHFSIALQTQEETKQKATQPMVEQSIVDNSTYIANNTASTTNSTLALDKLETDLIEQIAPINPLASLDIELDRANTDIAPQAVHLGDAIHTIKKGKAEKWLSMHASVDNNIIRTPRDPVVDIDPYNNFAAGFSGGVNFDLKADGVELGTGLSYSSVRYSPQEVINITGGISNGIVETSLKDIAFTYITVPLNLKFHFLEIGSWSSFAQFGINLNSVLTASYQNTEVTSRTAPVPVRPLNPNAFRNPPPVITSPPGLLEGGSFSDNIFLHASVGLGIQKNFSDKMGLYASLNYSNHFLNSLGPNDDYLDKASLTLGARYRL